MFPTRSDTNRAVQPQKIARGLKFRIKIQEGLYYPCSENKDADQLRGYREADLRLCFRICKKAGFFTTRLKQQNHFKKHCCSCYKHVVNVAVLQEQNCTFKPEDIDATESSCYDIKRKSETDLQKAVATQGPISVTIDAKHESFQFYR